MIFYQQRALELLRIGSRIADADFRAGQLEAILGLMEGNNRLLVVQKTGWGKSFVYFIATKLLRQDGGGPALLISPLLSLMRNQIAAAERMGVRAARITSDNSEEWEEIEGAISRDEIDILLIHPKRLNNDKFIQGVLRDLGNRVSLLVIDEAHCISDWGHAFMPEYRLIERLIRNLPREHRLLATTATANNRVMDDLCDVLGPDLKVMRGSLARPSLFLQTISFEHMTERLAWLADHIPTLTGCGIIYCLTIRDALRITNWLNTRDIKAEAYSGKSEKRPELEQKLLNNELKALVATTALGMGFDKPDLAFVIHFQTPGSVVAYYQQVGRAGRALKCAYGILLSGKEENDINKYFIESEFPKTSEVNQIIATLSEKPQGLSLPQLCNALNIRRNRIEKALQLMSLESPAPIIKERSKWILTANDLNDSFWQRAERLTQLRQAEWQEMQEYVALEHGHMEFLIRALDGDAEGYEPPNIPPISESIREASTKEATDFINRSSFAIEPRRQWGVSKALPIYGLRGNIPRNDQAEEGRVLSVWGDPGWGKWVGSGKLNGRFNDDLVEAMAAMLFDWSPDPRPAWLTYIPSLRHPTLVHDFARRLANRIGIRMVTSLEIVRNYPPQKSMQNPQQALQNLDGAFNVLSHAILSEPCYLLDDMVDSRWTLTVAGYLLKQAGTAEIFPIALASTTPS